MEMIDGAIYKLKVGLFAHTYAHASSLGTCKNIVQAGSHVYFDQIHEGSYVFGCFSPYESYFVLVPEDMLESHVELFEKVHLVPMKK